jgi:hypothetical protein
MMKPIFLSIALSVGLECSSMLVGSMLPAIAHQNQMSDSDAVSVMVHLEPNDTPQVGQPSLIWTMLMQPDGSDLGPNCTCRIAIYDPNGERIAHHVALQEMVVEEQTVMGTTMTFEEPGLYTLVVSGQANDDSFEAFELTFPFTVVP